jgi:2'-5' RNA ligase
MHRLFIGIALPPPVADLLIDAMDGIENARWQSEDQLHLTLRFVGEVDTPVANDLADALGAIRHPSFTLRISGVGHFARKGRATAVWAGVDPLNELTSLQRKVERICTEVGLAPERRKFMPHVTMARLGASAGPVGPFLATNGTLGSEPFPVRSFTLYESHLGKAGSLYESLMMFPLQ